MQIFRAILVGLLALITAEVIRRRRSEPFGASTKKNAQTLLCRISGISYSIEPVGIDSISANRFLWDEKYLNGIRKITSEICTSPDFIDPDAEQVASLRVRLHDASLGSSGGLIEGKSPVRYCVTYELYNPESGVVLLQQSYSREQPYVPGVPVDAPHNGDSPSLFDELVGAVTREFMGELAHVTGQAPVCCERRVIGSLGTISTILPVTRDNLHWLRYRKTGDRFAYRTYGSLMVDFPAKLTRRIQEASLFTHSPDPVYSIKIFLPSFTARNGGWLSSESFEFTADAVIYKGGKEIANVTFDTANHHGASLDVILQSYTNRILARLERLS